MSDLPQVPKLAAGAPIAITKMQIFSLDCPKCKSPLDVTNLTFGTNIECPNCNNVTWRPEFKPRWWFRLRNLVLSILLSFILGVTASITAAHIYDTINEDNVPAPAGKIEGE